MKYRRKPVARNVIDAVRLTLAYVFVDFAGNEVSMPHDEFEALYEPVVRKRGAAPKPKRGRPSKPPHRAALPPFKPTQPPPPRDEFDDQPVPAGMLPI